MSGTITTAMVAAGPVTQVAGPQEGVKMLIALGTKKKELLASYWAKKVATVGAAPLFGAEQNAQITLPLEALPYLMRTSNEYGYVTLAKIISSMDVKMVRALFSKIEKMGKLSKEDLKAIAKNNDGKICVQMSDDVSETFNMIYLTDDGTGGSKGQVSEDAMTPNRVLAVRRYIITADLMRGGNETLASPLVGANGVGEIVNHRDVLERFTEFMMDKCKLGPKTVFPGAIVELDGGDTGARMLSPIEFFAACLMYSSNPHPAMYTWPWQCSDGVAEAGNTAMMLANVSVQTRLTIREENSPRQQVPFSSVQGSRFCDAFMRKLGGLGMQALPDLVLEWAQREPALVERMAKGVSQGVQDVLDYWHNIGQGKYEEIDKAIASATRRPHLASLVGDMVKKWYSSDEERLKAARSVAWVMDAIEEAKMTIPALAGHLGGHYSARQNDIYHLAWASLAQNVSGSPNSIQTMIQDVGGAMPSMMQALRIQFHTLMVKIESEMAKHTDDDAIFPRDFKTHWQATQSSDSSMKSKALTSRFPSTLWAPSRGRSRMLHPAATWRWQRGS